MTSRKEPAVKLLYEIRMLLLKIMHNKVTLGSKKKMNMLSKPAIRWAKSKNDFKVVKRAFLKAFSKVRTSMIVFNVKAEPIARENTTNDPAKTHVASSRGDYVHSAGRFQEIYGMNSSYVVTYLCAGTRKLLSQWTKATAARHYPGVRIPKHSKSSGLRGVDGDAVIKHVVVLVGYQTLQRYDAPVCGCGFVRDGIESKSPRKKHVMA
ncbi:uncharacterized protein CTRU02_215807 [Colletotrichum truncatum]|uniref:Uncharacterized protein n=1 Tax=Colletotrichum truncatum TaxID=5467 RepID=A0ACC3YBS3_COLTU